MASEPVKPKTKNELRTIEKDLTRKIDYIVSKKLTDVIPSAKKIAQLAMKNGLTELEAVEYANKYQTQYNNKQANRERFIRMQGEKKGLDGLELEQYVSDGLGRKPKPKSFKQAFNDITKAILKDKTGQLKISEVINQALLSIQAKGVKFTANQLTQISNGIKKIDMSNLGSVYDFVERIKKIANNAEFTAISTNIRSMQSKAKKSNKNVPANQKKDIAGVLNLSPRKVENVAQLEELTKNILDYLNGTDDLDRGLPGKLKELQEQSDNYDTQKQKALKEAMYKTFLDENELTEDDFSMDDYNEMINASANSLEEDFKESNSNDKELSKKRQKLETLANYALEEIKNKKTKENKNWTETNKREFSLLKDIASKIDFEDLTNEQLKLIVRVNNEIQMYGKLNLLGVLNSELSGIVDMKKASTTVSSALRTFNNKIKEALFISEKGDFGFSAMSFGRYLDRIFIGNKAQEIGAILLGKYKFGLNIAKNNYYKFNDKFENAFRNNTNGLSKIDAKQNLDIGAKAILLSSPKGISELEAEVLFQEKIEKIKQDIETLKGFVNRPSTKSEARTKAEELIESYGEIYESMKDKTFESLTADYNNGVLFNKDQAQAFEIAKKQYESMSKELESSSELYGKGEFIMEDNYTAISYFNLGGMGNVNTENELDNEFQRRGVNDTQSGSKISRVSPKNIKGDNIYNFNFLEVTQRRVQDQLLDIHTLGAKLRLRSMINSKYFRNEFEGNSGMYDGFVAKLSELVNRQNVRTIFSLSKKAKREAFLFDAINRVKASALGTPLQSLKQGVILASTGIRFGVSTYTEANKMWIELKTSKEGRELLYKLLEGSDTSNRTLMGDARLKATLDKISKISFSKTKIGSAYESATYMADKILKIGLAELKGTDLMASEITFLSAMIDLQKKEGKYKRGDGVLSLIGNKTEDNTYQADQLHAQINNESDVSMQGSLYAGNEAKSKWLSIIAFNFQAHANNNSWNMLNSMLNMFDPKLSKEERYESAKGLLGGITQILTFRAVSEVVNSLKATGYNQFNNLIGLNIELPDDEDKKADEAYLDIWKQELWIRVLINSSADMVSGRLPSDLLSIPEKEFANNFYNSMYKRLTGR